MSQQTNDTFREALEQARYLCSRQEKCRHEIIEKLRTKGLQAEEVERAVSQLEKEGFLDDGRYALAFARDKSRLRHWGKMKIRNALYQKHIPPALIDQALSQIDDEGYQDTLRYELEKKLSRIKGRNLTDIKARLFRYAIGKGYESERVYRLMDELLNKRNR